MLETSCRAKEVDFITVSRGAIGSRMNRRILQLPASPTTAPPTIPLFNMGIEALPKIVDSVSFILSGALEGGLALYYLNVMVGVSRTLPTLSAACKCLPAYYCFFTNMILSYTIHDYHVFDECQKVAYRVVRMRVTTPTRDLQGHLPAACHQNGNLRSAKCQGTREIIQYGEKDRS